MSEEGLRLSAESQMAVLRVQQRIQDIMDAKRRQHCSPSKTTYQGAPLPPSVHSDTTYRAMEMRSRSMSQPDYTTVDKKFFLYHRGGNDYEIRRQPVEYEKSLLGWPTPGTTLELVANDYTAQKYRAIVTYSTLADGQSSGIVKLQNFEIAK